MNYKEKIEPTGHLQIIKVNSDNSREVLLDDHNIITEGMGRTLAAMFSHEDKTDSFDNFTIPYFQIGTGSATMVSSLTSLVTPLPLADYGSEDITLSTVNVSDKATTEAMIAMHPAYIYRSASNKVTYSVTIDESTANNKDLKEVGLWSKDPYLQTPSVSYLCAYRSFDAIPKRNSYTLIFNWTLEF
tara:strand:+ start:1352 stop:1912 length:561 start_codon:yes stop_codon:yes gene_type:complete